jgi:hypothetical protein
MKLKFDLLHITGKCKIVNQIFYFCMQVTWPNPLFAMLTSMPLWAHISMGVSFAWIGITMLTELPTFLSNILHYDIKSVSQN